jgi:hypothetical protein
MKNASWLPRDFAETFKPLNFLHTLKENSAKLSKVLLSTKYYTKNEKIK